MIQYKQSENKAGETTLEVLKGHSSTRMVERERETTYRILLSFITSINKIHKLRPCV